MQELAELGNTIIVVEHDRDIIENVEWVVELGPGGGDEGGNVIFSGEKKDFLSQDTVTAQYMKRSLTIEKRKRTRKEHSRLITLEGATGNNLKNVTLNIPSNTFTVISGVSGSGKSSLIVDTLYHAIGRKLKKSTELPLSYTSIAGLEAIQDVKLIDQSPLGRSPRSNPATYLKVFDSVRKIFADTLEARSKGYPAGFFSFNVPGGRCEECKGEGFQKIEMYFFEDTFITCPVCNGTRYSHEALRIAYRSKNISDILNMTIDGALRFFSDSPRIFETLSLLRDIGLGYLRLGQPANTLSGGEAQRLKICAELKKTTRGNTLYLLDEPTVGLHMHDISRLLDLIFMLIDRGDTVVVIEHNLDFIRSAEWIIDLGPEGGDRGGEIVFEGIPEKIMKSKTSITGRFLKDTN